MRREKQRDVFTGREEAEIVKVREMVGVRYIVVATHCESTAMTTSDADFREPDLYNLVTRQEVYSL